MTGVGRRASALRCQGACDLRGLYRLGRRAPELAAGISSSLRGVGEIALGAVVGSNTANVALILGASAMIFPIVSARTIRTKEIPLMLAAMLLGCLAMLGGTVGRIEGAALFAGILVYTWHTYAASKKEPQVFERELPEGAQAPLTRRTRASRPTAGLPADGAVGALIHGPHWFIWRAGAAPPSAAGDGRAPCRAPPSCQTAAARPCVR